jgi:hypothetical protein
MNSLYYTTSLLGVGLAAVIIFLLRRDHLHLSHGVFWLMVAFFAAIFGLWPVTIDYLAEVVGISYPPALFFLATVILLLIKALHADILNTRIERQVRRLNQRLAMYELDQIGNGVSKRVN